MTNTPRYRALIASLALTLAPMGAVAGTITIETGEGNVSALLQRDAFAFTDAVSQALFDATSAAPTTQVYVTLRSKVQGATIARIEYTFEKNGKTITRVYHGHSGHSLQTMIEKALKRPGGGGSGSESATSDSSGGSDIAEADDIARDASEGRFYPPDTEFDIRAPKLPSESSALESIDIGGRDIHAWDAELKTLRRIEADIERNIVPRGGRITGYVSKTVCESCRHAIEQFAKLADADGTVYELIEPSPVPRAADGRTLLQRSQASSAELLNLRKTYAKATLSKDAHTRLREGKTERFRAVEALENELKKGEVGGDKCLD
ncbi:MAG TPA: hypothetical protein VN813_07365 [Luteibacter sp.]|nr:hypothetical protein [Luteibacter sp.]